MDFLALILVVIDDRRRSSIKTKVCRLLRPTSGTREAFFRLLVQRYNNLELKTNFSATDFLEKRSFPVMVIFGQNHFGGRSVIL